MLRQTVGGIRLISALTVELDGAQTSFAKLQFHTISPATQTQSEISGHLLVLLNSFPSVDVFEVHFSRRFEHCIYYDCFLIFPDSSNLLPCEIARKCPALQVAVWRGCKVKRFAFRVFGLTLLALQVSDWTWAGAHWSGEVNRSQLAKALIRTCRIRSSGFIVFVCLLSHFIHDSLLRFAPSGLALLSGCLFWREKLSFITATPILPRHVQQGKS